MSHHNYYIDYLNGTEPTDTINSKEYMIYSTFFNQIAKYFGSQFRESRSE